MRTCQIKRIFFLIVETLKHSFHRQQVVFCLFNEPGSLWPHRFLAMSSDNKAPWRVEEGGSVPIPSGIWIGSSEVPEHQGSSVPSHGMSRALTSRPISATCHLSIRTAVTAVPEAGSFHSPVPARSTHPGGEHSPCLG